MAKRSFEGFHEGPGQSEGRMPCYSTLIFIKYSLNY